MGIIIQRSIWISVFSYLGIILGYVNLVLLFPRFLDIDQIGSVRFIQNTSLLFLQFAQVGVAPTLLRYYPIFEQRFSSIKGLVPSMLLIAVVAFGMFLVAFYGLQDYVWAYFDQNAPQARSYAGLILMLVFVMSIQMVMDAYSRSLLEVVAVNVLHDVGLRMMMTGLLTGYALGWYDFQVFLQLMVGTYGLKLTLLLLYLARQGLLSFSLDFSFWRQVDLRDVAAFSFSSFLGSSGSNLFRKVDSFMVTSMIGLGANGIYTTMFNVAQVIEVPMAAIAQISQPIIAKAFAANDLDSIATIYRKSSINQQLIGGLIFIGIWANLDNLFALMPQGDTFRQGYWVAVLIGLSKLIDMSAGANQEIINMSKFYRFNMYTTLLLAALSILTNWWLVPRFGMEGAALATLFTVVLFNAVKLVFLRRQYGMMPFSGKNVGLLVLIGLVLYVALRLPRLEVAWLDLLLRSAGITLLYGGLVLLFRISDDVNRLFGLLLRRIRQGPRGQA